MSPPGGNKGSWAAVEVEGIGSRAAVLSFLSDLPEVDFLEEGIFSLYGKWEKRKCYWQRIYSTKLCGWHMMKLIICKH